MDSLRDKDGDPLAYTGLVLEGDNLVANSTIKLTVKWKTNPRKTPKVSQFVILLEREEESEGSSEMLRKTAKGNTEQAKLDLKNVHLEPGEEWLVQLRIIH